MKAFTTIAIFLSALNVAYTLPTESLEVAEFTLDAPAVAVPAIDNQLVERAKQTLLRTCTNDNFDGRCLSWTANSRSTACTNTAGNGQQDNISSIQVFGTRCTFWVNQNCKGTSLAMGSDEGRGRLPTNFNNNIASFSCRG